MMNILKRKEKLIDHLKEFYNMKNIFGHKNNVKLYNSSGTVRYIYQIFENEVVEVFYNDEGIETSIKREAIL